MNKIKILILFMIFWAINIKIISAESIKIIEPCEISITTNSQHNGADIMNAYDGNINTFWDSAWDFEDKGFMVKPQIIIKFKQLEKVGKIKYYPRRGNFNGIFKEIDIQGKYNNRIIRLINKKKLDNDLNVKVINLEKNTELNELRINIINGYGDDPTKILAAAGEIEIFSDKENDKSMISNDRFILECNSEHKGHDIQKAFDNDYETYWDGAWSEGDKGYNELPVFMDIKLKKPEKISHIVYIPRQDGVPNGNFLDLSAEYYNEQSEKIKKIDNIRWDNSANPKIIKNNFNENISRIKIIINNGSRGSKNDVRLAACSEIILLSLNNSVNAITGDKIDIKNKKGKLVSLNKNVADIYADNIIKTKAVGQCIIEDIDDKGKIRLICINVKNYSIGNNLIFYDDFNGDELDLSKWNDWCVDIDQKGLYRYSNSRDVVVHPDNVFVKNGYLHLLCTKENTKFNGMISNYRTGMINSRNKFSSKYGRVEAKIKYSNTSGTNPAFWMMPNKDKNSNNWCWGGKDLFGAEIDILERPNPKGNNIYQNLEDKYWITMHYDNYNYINHKKYHFEPRIIKPYDWHVYGIEWTPKSIKYLLDGQVVSENLEDVPNMNENIIFSYGMGGWIGKINDLELPGEMLIDYVKWTR